MIDFNDDLPYSERMNSNKGTYSRRQCSKMKHSPRQKLQQSPMEQKIEKFLKSIGVKFIAEKKFPGMVSELNGDALRIDFYLCDYSVCVEIDGLQHFMTISTDKDEYDLVRRQLNDRTKDLYCLKHGIKMIRINSTNDWYAEEIIKEQLR